jgi:hypothetical protein
VKVTVACEHGSLVRSVDDVERFSDEMTVGFIRALILACPACVRDAQGAIEEPFELFRSRQRR